jgi:hypothetical protein
MLVFGPMKAILRGFIMCRSQILYLATM